MTYGVCFACKQQRQPAKPKRKPHMQTPREVAARDYNWHRGRIAAVRVQAHKLIRDIYGPGYLHAQPGMVRVLLKAVNVICNQLEKRVEQNRAGTVIEVQAIIPPNHTGNAAT